MLFSCRLTSKQKTSDIMPIGELETHPYLQQGLINGATKLILGSFPVYECTDRDNDMKQLNRLNEGTVRFFYGSNRNSLWAKYSHYIDNTISQPWNSGLIIESLTERGIAISDTIKSCERYLYKKNKKTGERILYPYSSEDSALHTIEWNTNILKQLITKGVTKVICTSKKVLADLESQIICKRPYTIGRLDNLASHQFQLDFIENIGGNLEVIKNPISKVFNLRNHCLTALAIPSPGSPQRKIKDFGCVESCKVEYAERYFNHAFEWFQH
jgi:hypothetical protein